MRYLLLFAVFILFNNFSLAQSQHLKLKSNPSSSPDYFVLKNRPDTIFVEKMKKYSLVNGQFTEVIVKTSQGKKKFSKAELADIQAYRLFDKARLVQVFEGDKKEHLGVITAGPMLLLIRPVYEEMETEDAIEQVRTDHYYWWQSGKMKVVDVATIGKLVQQLELQCGIKVEIPSASAEVALIELTNHLNQHCSNLIVW